MQCFAAPLQARNVAGKHGAAKRMSGQLATGAPADNYSWWGCPMSILLVLAAAAAAPSAVPANMTNICIPFVKQGVSVDETRAKIVALGLARHSVDQSGSSFTERYTNRRYEVRFGVTKAGRRHCGAFDSRASYAPMLAAARRIVAQDLTLKVDQKFSSFMIWANKDISFQVNESNDYSESDRIMPGMSIETQTSDWIPGAYMPG